VEFDFIAGQEQEEPGHYSAECTVLRALPTLRDAVHPRLVAEKLLFLVCNDTDAHLRHLLNKVSTHADLEDRHVGAPAEH
jgi:hypothetical protein